MRAGQRSAAICRSRSRPSSVLAVCALGPTAAWRHSRHRRRTRARCRADRTASRRLGEPPAPRGWCGRRTGARAALRSSTTSDYAFIVNGKADGSARRRRRDAGDGRAGRRRSCIRIRAPRWSSASAPAARPAGSARFRRWSASTWSSSSRRCCDVAEGCTPVNHDVLRNPKVHIRIGDAREVLLTSRDATTSSSASRRIRIAPASPASSRASSTRRVSARLNRGGIFLQWVQAYDVDARDHAHHLRHDGAVFPHVETWRTHEGDLLLVATREPITFDIDRLRQRVAAEPYRTALHATWRVEIGGRISVALHGQRSRLPRWPRAARA